MNVDDVLERFSTRALSDILRKLRDLERMVEK